MFDEIGAGGMATVHLGRFAAAAGFSRTVALKRLHPQFAKDAEFVAMFTDEARLASRIQHPNVATTLDVVAESGELLIVLEYIHGEPLSKLLTSAAKQKTPLPLHVVVAIVSGVLRGLHAAHEATSPSGEPLSVVHRDVSPQNIMVGVDGTARVLDFGIAKAVGRAQLTREGQVKGKMGYMSPEQLRGRGADRRSDVYAASVVLWEALTSHRLFVADSDAEVMAQVLDMGVEAPSRFREGIRGELDAVVMRGLSRDPAARYATALEMAEALERCALPASPSEVGRWVAVLGGEPLHRRAARVRAIEVLETAAPDPSRQSRWRVWAVAALLAALAILALWVQGRRGAKAAAVPTASMPTASAEVPTGLLSHSEVSPPPKVGGSPSPSSPAPIESEKGSLPRKPGTIVQARPSPLPKARAPQCNPPYTIDPDGIHIPKPECM